LIGSWRVASLCVNDASVTGALGLVCPAATVTNVATSHTGSLELTASDYSATATTTLSYTVTFPLACLGNVATCADVGDVLSNGAGVASASCSGSTICACSLSSAPVTASASGTYQTSGSTVTFMPSGGSPSTASYCVQGDRLHILDVETVQSMGAVIMRTRSDEVADRQ
jgi:hypothetical protein